MQGVSDETVRCLQFEGAPDRFICSNRKMVILYVYLCSAQRKHDFTEQIEVEGKCATTKSLLTRKVLFDIPMFLKVEK